ncbi:MAG: DoxX family protein [Roseiflexaceae bacterium]
MEQIETYGALLGRLLIVVIFFLNATGVVDQARPAREMAEFGVPPALIPPAMLVGRSLQLLGGLAVLTGFYPQLGALALIAFLVPATVIAHHFWDRTGAERQIQLANFLKNLAMIGGLVLVAARWS